jgi:hypothetical protein
MLQPDLPVSRKVLLASAVFLGKERSSGHIHCVLMFSHVNIFRDEISLKWILMTASKEEWSQSQAVLSFCLGDEVCCMLTVWKCLLDLQKKCFLMTKIDNKKEDLEKWKKCSYPSP